MSQAEPVSTTRWGEARSYSRQDQGKSSNVSTVTNQVTLKEIVDSLLRQNPFYRQNQGPSCTDKQTQVKMASTQLEALSTTVVSSKDTHPQQKAQAWLEGVAEEPDEVKDLVMQQLWRREDFQNA
jgi:hypothetical protein